jgi:putative sugar O-methyltransferase
MRTGQALEAGADGSRTDWNALTSRTLAGIETCDAIYRPTNFWGPGVERLLNDLEAIGLASFKSWPSAASWFYPSYGSGFTNATIDSTFEFAATVNESVRKPWFTNALNGSYQAKRDFDAARLTWDQSRWPFDIEGFGESRIGQPGQLYWLTESKRAGLTKPYLTYLLCLAALSRYLDAPPRSFLEIGGGYGVLGEILMSRDPEARYVNLDIPPLLTVSSYYLDALFDGRITVYDDSIADSGPIVLPGSACLPNWRIGDVDDDFDVFINTFSFQEMEPEVVEHYVSLVSAKQVPYVVSLNSKLGKPKAGDGAEIGVIDPVTSDRIVAMYAERGYELLGVHGDPLIQSAAELAILRRKGVSATPAKPLPPGPDSAAIDDRQTPSERSRDSRQRAHPPRTWLVEFGREWLPPAILRGLRRIRARLR